jgi:hypothetical protein
MASFDTLPLEVQFEIYSYLIQPLSDQIVPAVPATIKELTLTESIPADRRDLQQHPYNNIAATCQLLRSSVEAFCLHLLKGHQGGQKVPTIPKSDWSRLVARRAEKGGISKLPPAYRQRWLNQTFQKCIFCGKRTKRRAVFNRLMWCDSRCDLEHFGRLIVSGHLSTPSGHRQQKLTSTVQE